MYVTECWMQWLLQFLSLRSLKQLLLCCKYQVYLSYFCSSSSQSELELLLLVSDTTTEVLQRLQKLDSQPPSSPTLTTSPLKAICSRLFRRRWKLGSKQVKCRYSVSSTLNERIKGYHSVDKLVQIEMGHNCISRHEIIFLLVRGIRVWFKSDKYCN